MTVTGSNLALLQHFGATARRECDLKRPSCLMGRICFYLDSEAHGWACGAVSHLAPRPTKLTEAED